MSKRLIFFVCAFLAVAVSGRAFAETVLHYSFDGTLGEDVPSGLVDETGAYTAQIIAGDDPNSTIEYNEPNPTYNRGGTSAEFYNTHAEWSSNSGDTFVVPDNGGIDFSTFSAFTIEMFVYPYSGTAQNRRLYAEYVNCSAYLDSSNALNVWRKWGGGVWDVNATHIMKSSFPHDTWSHVAVTWDANAAGHRLKLYLDGFLADSAECTATATVESTAGFAIGGYQREPSSTGQFFHGMIDEFRLSDEALAPSQFLLYETGGAASKPKPGNGAENLCDGQQLCWTGGDYAQDVDAHDIYLGTDWDDVNDANTTSEVYVVSQDFDANCYTTSGLELATIYYWRIDEVNDSNIDSPWKGDVWQFTTNDGNAFDPDPMDGQTVIPLNKVLTWSAGCLADTHEVYFGTDINDVNAADTTSTGIYQGEFETTEYDPCDFEYFTWYYWRVDEVGASQRWGGKVWRDSRPQLCGVVQAG
jgi:hypothetical protein